MGSSDSGENLSGEFNRWRIIPFQYFRYASNGAFAPDQVFGCIDIIAILAADGTREKIPHELSGPFAGILNSLFKRAAWYLEGMR
jgi:hypothetical protein